MGFSRSGYPEWISSNDPEFNLFMNFNNDGLWRVTFILDDVWTNATVEINLKKYAMFKMA